MKTIEFSNENIKNLKISQANLSVRNFPLNVNELRKKLKWKEGGDVYVFATMLQQKKRLIICSQHFINS